MSRRDALSDGGFASLIAIVISMLIVFALLASYLRTSTSTGTKAGPVETPAGVELVKLQVKTVALNRSFEESKESIRGRMARERRSKDYDEFIKKLREGGKVAIDEVELAKVNPTEAPAPAMPVAQPVAPAETGPRPATAKIGGN